MAKLKTTVQLTFLILTLLLLALSTIPGKFGRSISEFLHGDILFGMLVLVVVVTVTTGIVYFTRVKDLIEVKVDPNEY